MDPLPRQNLIVGVLGFLASYADAKGVAVMVAVDLAPVLLGELTGEVDPSLRSLKSQKVDVPVSAGVKGGKEVRVACEQQRFLGCVRFWRCCWGSGSGWLRG